VALVARSEAKMSALAKELPHSFVVVADMADETAVKMMVQKVYRHKRQD